VTQSATPSCTSCYFYVPAEDMSGQVNLFTKPVGAPMCGKLGRVLGTPNSKPAQLETVARAIAPKCTYYMESSRHMMTTRQDGTNLNTSQPGYMTIGLGMPEFRGSRENAEYVKTCTGCSALVDSNVVMDELGFSLPLCLAKGKLIPPARSNYEASGCEYRHADYARTREPDTQGFQMFPELTNAITLAGSADPAKAYFKAKAGPFVDPTVRPTCATVTDEESAAGIRAWDRIEDPEGSGNEVLIPIFRRDYFSDNQARLIPNTGDDEHPEEYIDHQGVGYKAAVLWMHLDETPALHGQAGTGKTEFFRYMAWRMQLPFDRISITNSTELEDLAGKMHYSPENGTYFVYGRVPDAWSKPGVMCLDEPNVGPVDVWQFFRPLTDNSKQLRLDQNGGEAVPRHDYRYLGMAMNPAWDPRNAGTQVLGDADGSRLMHIFMDLPGEKLEREIILNRCKLDGYELPEKKLNAIMRIAKDLRDLDDTLAVTWGVRPQIKVARATRWFNLHSSYKLAVADYLEPEQQEMIKDIINNYAEGM
jgi:MoxR-like ATPase